MRDKFKTIKQEAYDSLQKVGLADKTDHPASLLSHGDLKRLELGRALASKPELLLADELLAGLGAEEANSLVSLIMQMRKEEDLTVIIIGHMLREIMKIVQRVIVLNFGEKIGDGPPQIVARDKNVIEAYLGKELVI